MSARGFFLAQPNQAIQLPSFNSQKPSMVSAWPLAGFMKSPNRTTPAEAPAFLIPVPCLCPLPFDPAGTSN